MIIYTQEYLLLRNSLKPKVRNNDKINSIRRNVF